MTSTPFREHPSDITYVFDGPCKSCRFALGDYCGIDGMIELAPGSCERHGVTPTVSGLVRSLLRRVRGTLQP
jgi:hypothetical protein